MKHLVDVEWLAKRLDRNDLVVVDASVMGSANQEAGIPGAVRFDIDGVLSRGVHDMLPPRQFERELRALGLKAGDRVVAYDADGIFSSARAWWMLRAAGIRAAVLDGGLPAWQAAGHEVAPVAENLGREGDVDISWESTRFRNARFVERRLSAGDPVLDARSAERFTGEVEDPREGVRAGHIPGAKSLPFTELEVDGHMLPASELRKRIAEHVDSAEQPLTASCGSGVTACVIALAATLAGHKHVSVYDGSWADWGAENSGRPVAVGE
ncbi:sulfurtransferase [Agrococcus casei]|uniref:Thiosulfate sulfurtransferase, rhodanese n=1 Tax=Agrococcus casei LMG 22410 TaxID=1255656 RepID=A0A1R4ER30_9MICO|nr:sulfurtransferase [Agrococcus casei]SJM46147.1 Thiosulfate sulfurtransferase, rhodanese [Agrococcus casei LMG 22410]